MGEPIKIYCDGKVIDGHAEIYLAIYDADGKVLSRGKAVVDEPCKSKMAAQYLAAIHSLEEALAFFCLGSVPVKLYVNSRALVKHLTGKWPVKRKSLLKLHQRAIAKIARFSKLITVYYGDNIAGMVTNIIMEEKHGKAEERS